MISARRGTLPTLASVLFSLAVISLIAAFGVYLLALDNGKTAETRPMEQDRTAFTPGSSNSEIALVGDIRRIRNAISERLSGGETAKFRLVFDRLERAATQNRIDRGQFRRFPENLRRYLGNGAIDEDELVELLNDLESSIIPP